MSIVKSRENLKALSQQHYGQRPLEYTEVDKFLDTLWHDMRHIFGLGQTKYAFDPNKYFKNSDWLNNGALEPVISDAFRLELMEHIRNTFVDCKISYTKTVLGLDGRRVERLIVIDWT